MSGAVTVVHQTRARSEQRRQIRQTAQSGAATGKGDYKHFMLKEIYEQPTVIGDTLNSFISPSTGMVAMPQKVLDLADAPKITSTSRRHVRRRILPTRLLFYPGDNSRDEPDHT